MEIKKIFKGSFGILFICFFSIQCAFFEEKIEFHKDSRIVIIGNNLASRMMNYGHFEAEMHVRYPDSTLAIRNMADPGNTPGFRPHSSRQSPWAFPGAEQFYEGTALANHSSSEGHFPTEDEWLTHLQADIILAFFGYSESFEGESNLENYKAELEAFIQHTSSQNYNGQAPPQLVLISPIAFENLSHIYDLPDGEEINKNLELYTNAMRDVAEVHDVFFVDVYHPSQKWFASSEEPLTIDGSQLNDEGYKRLASLLADEIFGNAPDKAEAYRAEILAAVQEKNWMWHQDIKIPNGVHAYGRRFDPFGPDNYPMEVEKIREMTAIRDQAIWSAAKGEVFDVASADRQTSTLPDVQTNFNPDQHGNAEYKYGQDALEAFEMAPGYEIELFASEREFEDLANPMQLTFDNKGRLWVATMPSYPHYKPGDDKPDDKIIILEDTTGDGKANKQTTFADGLHLPVGFAIAPEGVYVSQGTNLVLYKDTDGDGQADTSEILLSGFDDHDTHHAHSAYTSDPSGAIYMGEGVFLHTNVETSYGMVRTTDGGFYRYNPQRRMLERTAQVSVPNPWGIAFDEWGQHFYSDTSGPDVLWMLPASILPRYAEFSPRSRNLVEDAHRVRPTSGLEFVSSRHFPDEVQGDFLINNTIGFLGTKQHTLEDDGTGYTSRHRQDLMRSSDRNFRPVDMEFAPDGSLYIVDWHNVLIGHMQHNARDPFRDHAHGRIYRITYPERPLVEPPAIDGAPLEVLFDNLMLPEARARSRTRRELRGRDADEVRSYLSTWTDSLDSNDEQYERYLLEALWVSWGMNRVDEELLRRLLAAEDFRVRAAAVRVLRYTGHQINAQTELLAQAAEDEHGRVRLEAIVAASWLEPEQGNQVLQAAANHPLDDWMAQTFHAAAAHLNGRPVNKETNEISVPEHLAEEKERELFLKGSEIYAIDGFCGTCHLPDGKGLEEAGFPPLNGTRWVTGNEDRLIKLVLHGLQGPIEVLGKQYPGQVPMTPFGAMLNDEEVAAVLTYIRNAFGNEAPAVMPEKVRQVRSQTEEKSGFYTPQELLNEHPIENNNP